MFCTSITPPYWCLLQWLLAHLGLNVGAGGTSGVGGNRPRLLALDIAFGVVLTNGVFGCATRLLQAEWLQRQVRN